MFENKQSRKWVKQCCRVCWSATGAKQQAKDEEGLLSSLLSGWVHELLCGESKQQWLFKRSRRSFGVPCFVHDFWMDYTSFLGVLRLFLCRSENTGHGDGCKRCNTEPDNMSPSCSQVCCASQSTAPTCSPRRASQMHPETIFATSIRISFFVTNRSISIRPTTYILARPHRPISPTPGDP